MKLFFLFMIFQCSQLWALGQLDPASIDILDTILRKEQKTGTLIYTETISKEITKRIVTSLSRKKFKGLDESGKYTQIILTPKERLELNSALTKFAELRWDDSMFVNSKSLPEDSMWQYIYSGNKKLRELYNEKIKAYDTSFRSVPWYTNVFQFSPIMYLRNKTIFLLFILRICGNLCGIEELYFYRLENGSYKKWFFVDGGVF